DVRAGDEGDDGGRRGGWGAANQRRSCFDKAVTPARPTAPSSPGSGEGVEVGPLIRHSLQPREGALGTSEPHRDGKPDSGYYTGVATIDVEDANGTAAPVR